MRLIVPTSTSSGCRSYTISIGIGIDVITSSTSSIVIIKDTFV